MKININSIFGRSRQNPQVLHGCSGLRKESTRDRARDVVEDQAGALEGLDVTGVQDRVVAEDAAPRPDEHDSSHQNQV